MSIIIEFKPWVPFYARKKNEEIHRWLQAVAQASVEVFRSSMGSGPGHSAPGAWPNSQTGNLKSTIGGYATESEAVVGSNAVRGATAPYSLYLRIGTRKMDRRKMSDNALMEGMQKAKLGRWVEWTRS